MRLDRNRINRYCRTVDPSIGETIDIEKVRNAYISARENAAEENIFRQLRLNQWVKQSTRWMQMDKWDACAFPVKEEELIGRTCYGGLTFQVHRISLHLCLCFHQEMMKKNISFYHTAGYRKIT